MEILETLKETDKEINVDNFDINIEYDDINDDIENEDTHFVSLYI